MFRIAGGIAITAFIFVHSPERPITPVRQDATRWLERTREDIAQAALRSEAARNLTLRGIRPAEGKASPH